MRKRSGLNLLLKVLIILAAYWAVYVQVFRNHRLSELLSIWDNGMAAPGSWKILSVVVGLMLLNWCMEAFKWRLLVRKIRQISFLRSLRGVLAGLTVSLFTPNRTGEFFGRILVLQENERVKGIIATIVGSMSQLLITMIAGIPAMFAFLSHSQQLPGAWNRPAIELILLSLSLITLALLMLFLNLGFIKRWGEMLIRDEWTRLRSYLQVFGNYSRSSLLSVLGLSLLRYAIFGTQFFLMLRLFGVDLQVFPAMILIPSIYLVMTLFPSLTLAELGLRGTVTVIMTNLLLGGGGVYDIAALAASSSIWLLNLVIPAMAGTAVIAGLRIIRLKSSQE